MMMIVPPPDDTVEVDAGVLVDPQRALFLHHGRDVQHTTEKPLPGRPVSHGLDIVVRSRRAPTGRTGATRRV